MENGRARTGRPRRRVLPLGIKAVDQALVILKLVAAAPGPISLTALARQVGMDAGKLHRYLVSLCAHQFVEQTAGDGLYTIGSGTLSLAGLALARLDETAAVAAAVDRLSRNLEEAAFAYTWTQAGPVLIHVRHPPYALVNLKIGSVGPLHDTASGPVFLSYLDESLTRPLLRREAEREGLDEAALWAALRLLAPDIRAERVHWSEVTVLPKSAACAAPVLNIQGELLCVLGASFQKRPRDDSDARERLRQAVRIAAAEVSERIGYIDRMPGRGVGAS